MHRHMDKQNSSTNKILKEHSFQLYRVNLTTVYIMYENWVCSQQIMHRKTNTVWFHVYGVFKVLQFKGTEKTIILRSSKIGVGTKGII